MRGALFFILLVASPSLADTFKLDLSFFLNPTSAIPDGTLFSGTATVYTDVPGGNGPQPGDSLAYLDPWSRVIIALEDPSLTDPCIADGSCGVDVSVRGKAGAFAVIAFPKLFDLPPEEPVLAPIVPIGTLNPNDPCIDHSGGPCHQSGRLVVFDPDPLVVGTWEATLSAVPEPNAILMLASSVVLLAWVRRRRRA
jgi:hypothetical protein